MGAVPDCRKRSAEHQSARLGLAYGTGDEFCAVADGVVLCARRKGRCFVDVLDGCGGVPPDGCGLSAVFRVAVR